MSHHRCASASGGLPARMPSDAGQNGPDRFAKTVRAILILGSLAATALAQDASNRVRVPNGFKVTLFADDDLAHDVHSLTVDSLGRVVVSGPGYVRILVDQNADGLADRSIQFVDGPQTGSQGMYFDGRNLVCSGDDGLQIYRDDDQDDKADGPPEVFRRAMAGGEHHVHSIQRGPDGWWYVIAGNYAGITDAYVTLPGSPVPLPEAGVLMRMSPDFADAEIVADGFRNAYDFCITRQGDFFTFDSDGERDVSLPWYRPTRVFHVLPMSHAGWISRSWKRPDFVMDMPPVVGSFGRGSPTGVVCYQHTQFPAAFRGAIFVLDWTYGRVLALPLRPSGSVWQSEPIEFMSGVGSFGFAPTDAAVGPDGSLYISVGGRGTRGGVYRVTYSAAKPTSDISRMSPLARVLQAPQPCSSWSRRIWIPLAGDIGKDAFAAAAIDERLSEEERLRAIEVLTEKFGGISLKTAGRLTRSDSERVRARAAWAIGRRQPAAPDARALMPFLADRSVVVRRFALEALQSAADEAQWAVLLPALADCMSSDDRYVRETAARVAAKLSEEQLGQLSTLVRESGRGTVSLGLAVANRSYAVIPRVLELSIAVLDPPDDTPAAAVSLRRDAARLMQLALGDAGPRENGVPAWDGYAARADLTEHAALLDPMRQRIARVFPTGDSTLDLEVSRVISMLTLRSPTMLDKLLAKIDSQSDPVSDIHYLLVAARVSGTRTPQQRQAIASALLALDKKLDDRNRVTDSNWLPRITELYRALVEHDVELPPSIATHPDFGRSSHVMFLSLLRLKHLQPAIDAIVLAIESTDEYRWTNDVVRTLSRSKNPAHHTLLRAQADNPAVRDAVLVFLAREPRPEDRPRYVAALESADRGLLKASINALSQLPPGGNGVEFASLVRAARRLGAVPAEFPIRESVLRLLQRNTGQSFGFVFGSKGHRPQAEVLNRWTEYVEKTYPDGAIALSNAVANDLAILRNLMKEVSWDDGDPVAGRVFFEKHNCAQCHGSRRALGPDLAGVTARFARDDLFTAIVAPGKDVSTRYQTTLIQTAEGKVHQGLIIYRSVDGLLLRTPLNQTLRIEAADIEVERTLPTSLMPEGALRDATAKDLADLYAYLGSLRKPGNRAAAPMSPTGAAK